MSSRSQERTQRRMAEKQAELSKEQTEHDTAVRTAYDRAREGAFDLSELKSRDFVDAISEPGIGRDPAQVPDGEVDDIEAKLSAEFPRHLALGDITRQEWYRQQMLDQARSLFVGMEHARPGRIGSRVKGEVAHIMLGDAADAPELTDDRARQLDAAYEERSMARSLSINGRGFRGVTEAVLYRHDTDGGSGGSVLDRVLGRIF